MLLALAATSADFRAGEFDRPPSYSAWLATRSTVEPSSQASASASAEPTPAPSAGATESAAPTAQPASPAPLPSKSAVPTAKPAPAITSVPLSKPSTPSLDEPTDPREIVDDRLSRLADAAWDCHTFAGTELTHTFRFRLPPRADVAELDVDTILNLPARGTTHLYERYTFPRLGGDARRWAGDLADGAFLVSGAPWFSDPGIFVGTSTEHGREEKVRVLFAMLDANVFRRDYQNAAANGQWQTYDGETCLRISSLERGH